MNTMPAVSQPTSTKRSPADEALAAKRRARADEGARQTVAALNAAVLRDHARREAQAAEQASQTAQAGRK